MWKCLEPFHCASSQLTRCRFTLIFAVILGGCSPSQNLSPKAFGLHFCPEAFVCKRFLLHCTDLNLKNLELIHVNDIDEGG